MANLSSLHPTQGILTPSPRSCNLTSLSKKTMAIKDRRARQKQLLRQEILDAARDIFIKEGYDRLSMRRIADRIEYSPTAIYLHFRDKQELVFSLCEETFSRLVRELESLDGGRDPVARLKLGMRRYVDFGLRNPQHYLATFVVPHDGRANPQMTARYQDEQSMGMRALGILRAQVEACVAAKKLRRVDVETATRVLWSAIHGITSLVIVFPLFPWGDREAVIGMLIDAAVDGLRPARG
jgi:AcrR family transcriptional regulator